MKKDVQNILIIPDSFKGSLSAAKVAAIIAKELEKSEIPIAVKQLPLADGGEGSLAAIRQSNNFKEIKLTVFDPLMKKVDVVYLFDSEKDIAYIELAQASGFHLIVDTPDIMHSTTFGTGQQIRHAIEKGAQKIVLFIGGSATNDAGLGILDALGYSFFNRAGQKIRPLPVNLSKIETLSTSTSVLRNSNVEIIIAADVTNPFYGSDGAAFVYAPQKGASTEEIVLLDAGLKHIADLILQDYNIDLQDIEGAGAAGGVGGGLCALAEAKIVSGAELIFDLLNIEEKIKDADIIISGEGKIDQQSLNNKLLCSISKLVKKYNKQLWAICGYFDGDEKLKNCLALSKVFSLAKTKDEILNAISDVEKRLLLMVGDIVKNLL